MWKFKSADDSGGDPLLRSLNGNIGRQTWVYEANAGSQADRENVDKLRERFAKSRHTQKHSGDELLRYQNKDKRRVGPFPVEKRGLDQLEGEGDAGAASGPSAATTDAAMRNAISFFETMQDEDGHWPGDYGGPMFLMPGMLIALYCTGTMDTVLSEAHKTEMRRYLFNHQNEDGGYGLHIEGNSTMFGTVLSYVSLRLLGLAADHEVCAAARAWIHARGGAHAITSWGKFWLAVLGVYEWHGLNPMPPEMWLLPYSAWTGIGWLHPGRFWCHCRMVYLPMSYIYGIRGTCKPTDLTKSIKKELYPCPYESIDWDAARNLVAKEDLYYPHPAIQDVLWWTLSKAERFLMGSWLRKKALAETMVHIHYEDENTRYVDIGPVNKVLNMMCCWFEDPESEAFKRHLPRLYDYLWVAEDGMKMQGYNGSQLWDTSFAVQAIASTGLASEFVGCLRKAGEYVDNTQVIEEAQAPLSRYYRHISKGAWPFSTRDHGWPISDCTSEGLKAAMALKELESVVGWKPLPLERLDDCLDVILSYQNGDGGFATYENMRSFGFLELINPSETFGDIVVDYNYVECTSACVTAMTAFAKNYPGHRTREIQRAIAKAMKYVKSIQKEDGSWYGNWAVCFTYATWFGLKGLSAIGETCKNSSHARRACEFLVSKQEADGGWGESYLSCQDKVYSHLPDGESHVVNTAWAMLGLLAADYHQVDRTVLDRAAAFLIRAQSAEGDWPQQHISGVFNRNCMISYTNYRYIFPLWSLGEYRKKLLS